MGYAFISYSTLNKASADAIHELFSKHKIDTWMAPYDIPAGSKYAGVITKAIRECSCFVLLLSNDSQGSEAVDKEVEMAAVLFKKTIITVELEKVVLNDQFLFYVHNQQIIPVYQIDENSREIKQVLDAVRAYTGISVEDNDTELEAQPDKEDKTEVIPKKRYFLRRASSHSASKRTTIKSQSSTSGDEPVEKIRLAEADESGQMQYAPGQMYIKGENCEKDSPQYFPVDSKNANDRCDSANEAQSGVQFSSTDCQRLQYKHGNGDLSFMIPVWFEEITEYSLSRLQSQELIIPATIRQIHPRAFAVCSNQLKTVLISSRNPNYTAKNGEIIERATDSVIRIPDRISVRVFID